jgi:hypothetical protein
VISPRLIFFAPQDMPQLDELFTSVEQYDNMNIHYLSVSILPFGRFALQPGRILIPLIA